MHILLVRIFDVLTDPERVMDDLTEAKLLRAASNTRFEYVRSCLEKIGDRRQIERDLRRQIEQHHKTSLSLLKFDEQQTELQLKCQLQNI